MLKLAIPNKGALSEDAVRLLGEAGYKCSRSGRELVVSDRVNDIDFVFLRPRDIALYVGDGVLDLGITGRDLKEDSGADVIELFPLGFGDAVKICDETKILRARQIVVDIGVIRDKRGDLFGRDGILSHGDPVDLDFPLLEPEHADHRFERCGFSGAVVPDESVDLPVLYGEREVVDGALPFFVGL